MACVFPTNVSHVSGLGCGFRCVNSWVWVAWKVPHKPGKDPLFPQKETTHSLGKYTSPIITLSKSRIALQARTFALHMCQVATTDVRTSHKRRLPSPMVNGTSFWTPAYIRTSDRRGAGCLSGIHVFCLWFLLVALRLPNQMSLKAKNNDHLSESFPLLLSHLRQLSTTRAPVEGLAKRVQHDDLTAGDGGRWWNILTLMQR